MNGRRFRRQMGDAAARVVRNRAVLFAHEDGTDAIARCSAAAGQ